MVAPLALFKGTLEDGSTDYAMINEPGTTRDYIGSLSEEDAIDERHAILGALTKFRLILEMMSEQEGAGEEEA